MPRAYKYICNHCDYIFHIGTGDETFVMDKEGNRILCTTPWQWDQVKKLILESWNIDRELDDREYYDFVKDKIGNIQVCVCLDCLEKVYLIWDSDERICLKCKSKNVLLIEDLVGKRCPNCDAGTIEKVNFGISD